MSAFHTRTLGLARFLGRFGLLGKHSDGFSLLKKGISAKLGLSTAVHIGAHLAEERADYEALGFSDVLWVEASAEMYQGMVREFARPTGAKTRHIAVHALVSERAGEQRQLRHFSNNGESSSIFAATPVFRAAWPTINETGRTETITSCTADQIAAAHGFNSTDLLVADVQGAELLVLKGATKLLATAKAVVVEVSKYPYYEGGALQPEIRDFLRSYGFAELRRPPNHGDQLYLRA
jgi:FkbM family methyltransferase